MNIVFMGTPDFSVPCLNSLIEAGYNISGVFTQPDKPKNRGHKMQMPPVKECALSHGIEVYQPLSLRKGDDAAESMETLKRLNPDCIVVVAYGQLLPKEVLELPKYGCINVHASLLPLYRGAAPIQRVIMDGCTVTGVTTMHMAEGLDTGDMILKDTIEIGEKMTGGELHDALSAMGARLIVETLKQLENGTAPREVQSGDTCYAKMLDKDTCKLDFTQPAEVLYNQIRGLSPAPSAFTFLGDKRLKVYFAEKCGKEYDLPCGTVLSDFTVVCGDKKTLRFTDIQLEGGKRMSVSDYLRGRKIEDGTVLG